ncbi:unnamed protein product [Arctogadus glacialis]
MSMTPELITADKGFIKKPCCVESGGYLSAWPRLSCGLGGLKGFEPAWGNSQACLDAWKPWKLKRQQEGWQPLPGPGRNVRRAEPVPEAARRFSGPGLPLRTWERYGDVPGPSFPPPPPTLPNTHRRLPASPLRTEDQQIDPEQEETDEHSVRLERRRLEQQASLQFAHK